MKNHLEVTLHKKFYATSTFWNKTSVSLTLSTFNNYNPLLKLVNLLLVKTLHHPKMFNAHNNNNKILINPNSNPIKFLDKALKKLVIEIYRLLDKINLFWMILKLRPISIETMR